jgi:hypothetical protein
MRERERGGRSEERRGDERRGERGAVIGWMVAVFVRNLAFSLTSNGFRRGDVQREIKGEMG